MSHPNIETVKSRRAAIKAEMEQLRAREDALVEEDRDLAVAEKVLLRLAGEPEISPESETSNSSWEESGWVHPNRPAPGERGTVEDNIEWLLEGCVSPWATTAQINAALNTILKRTVPVSTVAPTLSNMKNKGTIIRDGLKVALASRVPKNNEAARELPLRRL